MNELDLHKVGVRGINSQLHSLPKNTNEKHWVIQNPKGQHSIAVGLDAPLQIDIRGHVGFYCGGMNKDAELTIHGHAGVGDGGKHDVRRGLGEGQCIRIGGRHGQWRACW